MHKKSFALCLILILLITFIAPAYADVIIYENVDTQTISKGVTLSKISQMTKEGWQSVSMITADLNDPYIDMQVLSYGGKISGTANVKTFVSDSNGIAGINADFFQRKNGSSDASALGVVITDGKLKTSPAADSGMASVMLDWDKTVTMDYMTQNITLTAPNGEVERVKHVNKHDTLDGVVIYTPEWGVMSIGSKDGIVEMVVTDGIVTEIRRDLPPVEIPSNGYTVNVLYNYNTFLTDNFQEGDEVELNISLSPNLTDIKSAVGGGTLLVKEGKKVSFTHNITGRHPRTALGIDKTGKILYLITVDGRVKNALGMTQDELADFMLSHGIYTGINFDGGGSTTMVSRYEGSSGLNVVNTPSDGALRTVTNAVGIVSHAEESPLSSLIIESANPRIFNNSSRILTVRGLDASHNPKEIDTRSIDFSIEGVTGYFRDMKFYPTSSGTGKITARIGNATGTYDVIISDKPYSLQLSSKQYTLDGKDKNASLSGKDKDGYSIPINFLDAKCSVSNDVALVESGVIRPRKAGSGLLTVSFDEVTAYASVDNNGDGHISIPKDISLPDALSANPYQQIEKTIGIFSNSIESKTFFDQLAMRRLTPKLNQYADYIAFMNNSSSGNFNSDIVDISDADALSHIGIDVVTLYNSSGTLRGLDNQWKNFINRCESLQNDDVIVFLSNSLDSFSDQKELQLFKDILTEKLASKGKNVFVFYGGSKSGQTTENGVRYIGVPALTQSPPKENIASLARNLNVVLLHKTSLGLTYEVMELFD